MYGHVECGLCTIWAVNTCHNIGSKLYTYGQLCIFHVNNTGLWGEGTSISSGLNSSNIQWALFGFSSWIGHKTAETGGQSQVSKEGSLNSESRAVS